VNIKLAKCGGLTWQTHDSRSKQLGMKTMVGCIRIYGGISLPLTTAIDYVDMDGALLLAEDIARNYVF
jgi:hypothetical protein